MLTPILFIVFNRPDTTAQVFQAIRKARPRRLYVAADGPRPERDEARLCDSARRTATDVDWPCELKTLFRASNLGCKRGVAGAIDWFFEQEPEGIVLEDDVVPDASFFPYCEELLERFRADKRVSMIGGSNFVSNHVRLDGSYGFSVYGHIWGWATWRRAWADYDREMADWPRWRDAGGLERLRPGDRPFIRYWRTVFDAAHAGKIDTWDYQWQFSNWRAGRLATIPAVNLTLNIGFRGDATHTKSNAPECLRRSVPRALKFPLTHSGVLGSDAVDLSISRKVFGITWSSYVASGLRGLLRPTR